MVDHGRRWGEFFLRRTHCGSELETIQILSHVKQMLGRKDKSLQDLVKSLQVYRDNVDDPGPADGSSLSQKDILENLMVFLSGS